MNFWKKLFAGMGFVCGFLVFETMSLAYRNSSRRHKNRKGRCRRNSSWDTLATVYKGNIIKNLIMDCQSYAKYRPNETTGGIFVSWRRKEELPTGA